MSMKDFVFRSDTKLLFRNDIRNTIAEICRGQKVMFVYGTSSALRNGCREDVVTALETTGIFKRVPGNPGGNTHSKRELLYNDVYVETRHRGYVAVAQVVLHAMIGIKPYP